MNMQQQQILHNGNRRAENIIPLTFTNAPRAIIHVESSGHSILWLFQST